jgi:hypothetical protein
MRQNIFEHWRAGCGSFYLYTENPELRKVLRKNYGRCATYRKGRHDVGWQFMIKSSELPQVGRLAVEVENIEKTASQTY